MLPLISVILPVLDGRATMPRLLDELLRQNYPPDRFEILVVDLGSNDGTADLVRRRYAQKYSCVRLLSSPSRRASAGRNLGVSAARGQVLVFIDGHCAVPADNLLEDTAAILSRTGAGCLCRPQPLSAPAETQTGEVIAQARSSWLGRSRSSQAGDPQASMFVDPVHGGSTYRREVFDRVGLFDEDFDACAEDEFNLRVRNAGIRAYTDPRLAVDDRPPATLRTLMRQMMARGRGQMQLMRKYPGAAPLSALTPLAVLVALLLTPLVWLLLPRVPALVASLPLALVAGAVAVASLQLGIRRGLACLAKAPWVFAVIGCGAGAGIVMEALFPARAASEAPSSAEAATAASSPAKTATAAAPLVIPCPLPDLEPLQQTDRAA
jgi:succinoglycan biosynthesis protein ExoA